MLIPLTTPESAEPAPAGSAAGAADSGVVSGMSMGFDFLNGG